MSKLGAGMIKLINPLFKKPVHPFNLNNEGIMTYADWEYEKARDALELYNDRFSPREMFEGKEVLDCGCGEGGKTVYYAGFGAKRVVGVDIFPEYGEKSRAFAEKKGCHVFEFRAADAAALPFPNGSFDTVVMNDFVEHVSQPEAALREALRVLKPGGRIYTNFPPYYHPYGAHLSDAIGIPWVHAFFRDDSLIRAYRDLVEDLPDGEDRVSFRFSADENGKDYISYINKMTIRRFQGILESLSITPLHYEEIPLRPFLGGLSRTKLFHESLTRMVVCVIEKSAC